MQNTRIDAVLVLGPLASVRLLHSADLTSPGGRRKSE